MVFFETKLAGVFEIGLELQHDDRGFFARTWCRKEFESHGLNPRLVQCNLSLNTRKGTLRGMHYQAKPHAEAKFVVVDFGSTDNSKDITSGYASNDSRISFRETPKCGLAAARNAACFLAKGRYIAVQDADDIPIPNRLTAEVDFMEKHPEVGLVGSGMQRIDGDGKYLATVKDLPTEDQEIKLKLKEWNTFWQPTVVMLREAFVGVGGYREVLPQSEDYDLWLRISEQYKCANLSEILVKYRIHPYQVSVRKRKEHAAASLRQEGKPDPLISATEITPRLLAGMGVSEAKRENAIAEGYISFIKDIYLAGGYATVPEAAAEMFKLCESQHVDQRLINDAHILSAKVSWKQRKIVPSILSVGRAVLAHPRAAGRPFKRLLRLFSEQLVIASHQPLCICRAFECP